MTRAVRPPLSEGRGTGSGAIFAVLLLAGAGWGLSTPLMKIAVSQGYGAFGLVFWQQVVAAVVLGTLTVARGERLALTRTAFLGYGVIALLGGTVPSLLLYVASARLPAGLIAILMSMAPLFTFPIALALGDDRLSASRVLGLVLGAAGVLLIVGPEASLPQAGLVGWVLVALAPPFLYGVEANAVSRLPADAPGPFVLLLGASLLGAPVAGAIALAMGQFIDPRPPWGAPDAAVVATGLISPLAYSGYVWLVGRAGAVFAAQVSFLVTGFGVLWAMLILGERYPATVWIAFVVLLSALPLVQPRPRASFLVSTDGDAKV